MSFIPATIGSLICSPKDPHFNIPQKLTGGLDLAIIAAVIICAALALANNAGTFNLPGLGSISNQTAWYMLYGAAGLFVVNLITLCADSLRKKALLHKGASKTVYDLRTLKTQQTGEIIQLKTQLRDGGQASEIPNAQYTTAINELAQMRQRETQKAEQIVLLKEKITGLEQRIEALQPQLERTKQGNQRVLELPEDGKKQEQINELETLLREKQETVELLQQESGEKELGRLKEKLLNLNIQIETAQLEFPSIQPEKEELTALTLAQKQPGYQELFKELEEARKQIEELKLALQQKKEKLSANSTILLSQTPDSTNGDSTISSTPSRTPPPAPTPPRIPAPPPTTNGKRKDGETQVVHSKLPIEKESTVSFTVENLEMVRKHIKDTNPPKFKDEAKNELRAMLMNPNDPIKAEQLKNFNSLMPQIQEFLETKAATGASFGDSILLIAVRFDMLPENLGNYFKSLQNFVTTASDEDGIKLRSRACLNLISKVILKMEITPTKDDQAVSNDDINGIIANAMKLYRAELVEEPKENPENNTDAWPDTDEDK